MIRITAFKMVPGPVQGLVRDLRVRWALEEAGLPYEVRLISRGADQQDAAYRKQQPFGQVPVYEEEGLTLFESGAIVLHVAEKAGNLLPQDPGARSRARMWLISALSSVEPQLANLVAMDLFYAGEEWAKLRRAGVMEMIRARFADLSKWLDGKEYLEPEGFTAGDLMMATVLRIPRHTELMKEFPVLGAYLARCEARPAFQKALADQLRPFQENA